MSSAVSVSSLRDIRRSPLIFTVFPIRRPFGGPIPGRVPVRSGVDADTASLFSIGNLTALFSAVWPACWSKFTECNSNWVAAVTYLQIIGIIFGQIIVGIEGHWIGRKFGLVQDALIMTREGDFPR
jgi:hypothetical protein